MVNQTFVYYPTFARMFGQNANHFLDNAQLTSMRKQVDKSGQLPSHGATLSVPIPGTGLKFTPRPAYVWVPPAWFGRNRPSCRSSNCCTGLPAILLTGPARATPTPRRWPSPRSTTE